MTTAIDTILLSAGATLSQPDVTRLTTQSIDGTGVFDVLMKSIKQHLIEEYEADRITGAEYTQVYLGALNTAMTAALQFLLNSQQEEKIQAEIALTRQKTVTELAQTDDDLPLGLGFNGDTQVEGLVALQREKLTQEGLLVDAQVTRTTTENALNGQQIITELAKTGDDFTQASVAGYGYNSSSVLAGILKAELEKMAAEEDQIAANIEKIAAEKTLINQKVVTELASTSDTKPTDLGLMTGTTDITGLVASQKSKADAEVVLLAQKANTELAQTSDTVKTGAPYLNTLTSVTGVISKQKNLYTAQTDGFSRDAEQKLCKIMADTWSVSASQSEATANSINHLDDVSIGAVITKAKAGIGV